MGKIRNFRAVTPIWSKTSDFLAYPETSVRNVMGVIGHLFSNHIPEERSRLNGCIRYPIVIGFSA
jgi:hypothetical protein